MCLLGARLISHDCMILMLRWHLARSAPSVAFRDRWLGVVGGGGGVPSGPIGEQRGAPAQPVEGGNEAGRHSVVVTAGLAEGKVKVGQLKSNKACLPRFSVAVIGVFVRCTCKCVER